MEKNILNKLRCVFAAISWVLLSTGSQANDKKQADPLLIPAQQSSRVASKLMIDVFALSRRLVAVGEHGLIIYSDNQGKSWTQAQVPVSVGLTSVYFVNDELGWVVGHDGIILGTRDGGANWTKLFDGNLANEQVVANAELREREKRESFNAAVGARKIKAQRQLELAENALLDAKAGSKFGPARPFFSVLFNNASEGFVAGSFGQLFYTKDGGKNWSFIGDRLDNPENLHLYSINLISSRKISIAGEGGRIYFSDDGGDTWRRLETGYNGQWYGMLVFRDGNDKDIFLAYGFGGRIYRSQDEGDSWAEVKTEFKRSIVRAFHIEDGSIRLVDASGRLIRSDDYGMSFKLISAPQKPVSGATRLSGQVFVSGVGGVNRIAEELTAK